MVTRRNLLVGSAAMLGAVGMGTLAATGPAAAALSRAASGFKLPGGLFCPVPYLSRAAWGADESWRFTNGVEDWPLELHPTQALTVHHTGFAASADPAETVRTIYKQQALTPARGGIKGWGDIGYNLLIDANGVVYEGRSSGSEFPVYGTPDRLMSTGGHVQYFNTGNIGVCLLGYLNDTPATQAAQNSLVTVLAYLAAVAELNPLGSVSYYNPVPRPDGTHSAGTYAAISGHRNWAPTDCPGDAEYPLLGTIRSQVAAAKPSLPSPTQTGDPTPTSTASPTDPAPTTTQPQPTTPTTTTKPPTTAPRPERGGDEYVAAARSASPSQFPTKAPPTTAPATVDAVPTSSAAASSFSSTGSPTAAAAAASDVGFDLTATAVGATVFGVGALGTLGTWWLRRRRLATTTPSTVDPAPVGEDPLVRPAAEPTPE